MNTRKLDLLITLAMLLILAAYVCFLWFSGMREAPEIHEAWSAFDAWLRGQ